MADVAQQFSIDDLRSSVGQLHDALSNDGGDAREVCKQALALLDKCTGIITTMQENQGETRKSYRALRQSQTWSESQIMRLSDKVDGVLQGVEALLTVNLKQIDGAGRSAPAAKSRLSIITGRDRTAPAVASDDPTEAVRKGLVKQAIAAVFGPKGGREVAYDARIAAPTVEKMEQAAR